MGPTDGAAAATSEDADNTNGGKLPSADDAEDVEQQVLLGDAADAEAGVTPQMAPVTSLSGAGASPGAAVAGAGGAAADDAAAAAAAARRKATFAVCFWLIMSCIQILANKFLFNGPFKYPITLTSIHMGFATLATTVLRAVGWLELPPMPTGWRFFLRNFFVISVLFATALACGNVAAMRLSVSFVHILKATTPVVALGVSIAFGVAKPCWKQGAIVTAISAGVIIASFGELLFDGLGFGLQLVAVLAESVRLVVLQKLLQQYVPKASPLATLSLFAPAAAVCLAILSLTLEPGGYRALAMPGVGALVAANTASAFTLNIAVMLLVGATSGLTLVLAGSELAAGGGLGALPGHHRDWAGHG
jgi:drug/metabolite transporter (DMT)-like permease